MAFGLGFFSPNAAKLCSVRLSARLGLAGDSIACLLNYEPTKLNELVVREIVLGVIGSPATDTEAAIHACRLNVVDSGKEGKTSLVSMPPSD